MDPAGNIAETLQIDTIGFPVNIEGFWDEQAGMITFSTSYSQPSASLRGPLVFFGYLFKDTMRLPGLEGSGIYTLAGYVQGLGFAILAPRRHDPLSPRQSEVGWYAQIGVN